MKNEEVRKFYERLAEDDQIIKKLSADTKKISNKKELEEFLRTEVAEIARKKKFNITEKDLLNYEKENFEKLSMNDILNVSGGISPKSLIISGGIMSMILLGAGLGSSVQTHAEVSHAEVADKTSAWVDKFTEAVAGAPHGPAGEAEDGAPPQDQASDKSDSLQDSTSAPDQITDVTADLSTDIEASTSQGHGPAGEAEDGAPPQDQASDKSDSLQDSTSAPDQIADVTAGLSTDIEASTSQGQDAVEPATQAIKRQFSDPNYVVEALNLVDPYIYNFTDMSRNLRFYDAYKEKITMDGTDWTFIKDQGEGCTNFMKMLFPSASGEFTVESNASRPENFKGMCNPTAELIADIACWLHDYRCQEETKKKATKEAIAEVVTWDQEKLKNAIFYAEVNKFVDDIVRNKKISKSVLTLYKNEKQNPLFKNQNVLTLYRAYKNGKNTIEDEVIKGAFKGVWTACEKKCAKTLEKANLKSTDILGNLVTYVNAGGPDNKKVAELNCNRLKGVAKLLSHAIKMIDEQEKKGVDDSKILPQYTAERMLMAYFLKTQNKEDVDKFYNRVAEKLDGNLSDTGLAENIKKLKSRNEILKKLNFCYESPYRNNTVENALAYQISKESNEMVHFDSKTFADCADISVRHVINLLCYNGTDQWNNLLKGANKEELSKTLESVKKAIENNGSIEFKTLKERLQLFFLHQKNVGADKAERLDRTLWEYAISFLNEENNLENEKYYNINYANGKSFELETGVINSLKLIYNVASALEIAEKSKLEAAKTEIDNWEKNEKDKLAAEKLEKLIRAVYGLMPNAIKSVEINNFEKREQSIECFGTITIKTENGFEFEIVQGSGHAFTKFSPYKESEKEFIKENKATLENDEMSAILVGFTNNKLIKPDKISLFNRLYFEKFYTNDCSDDFKDDKAKEYFNNYKLLKFLKALQGEINNNERIDNEWKKMGGLDLDKVSLKLLKKAPATGAQSDSDAQKRRMKAFIYENYVARLSPENMDTILNSNESFGKFLKTTLELPCTEVDGVSYSYEIEGTEIKIYPLENNINKLCLPDQVTIEETEYTVKKDVPAMFFNCEIKELTINCSQENLTIGSDLFKNSTIKKIIVKSDTLKALTIGKKAFYGCKALKTFTVPEEVTNLTIGEHAFSYCVALTGFTVPKEVTDLTIGNYAFSYCQALTGFNISSEKVTDLTIGGHAFSCCETLTGFTVPQNVTNLTIGNGAFDSCYALKTFTISSKKVTDLNIGGYAFEDCQALTGFTVPQNVTDLTIGGLAFSGCQALKTFTVPEEVTNLTIGEHAFDGCQALTGFTISSENVTNLTIGNYAFSYCRALTGFTVPQNVTNLNIGEHAFDSCYALKTFTISSKKVTNLNIGDSAFKECTHLTGFTVPQNVTNLNIGEEAFNECTHLTDFTVPQNVTNLTIGEGAFYGCRALTGFNISSENITNLTIGNYAFSYCRALTGFTVPQNVTNLNIGEHAFNECTALKTFTISSEKVTDLNIGDSAFKECTHLTGFTVPQNVTNLNIGEKAFNECTHLTDFTVPQNVTNLTIGGWAFGGCRALTGFNISSENITDLTIGGHAFSCCETLTGFTVPQNVTNLTIGGHAFSCCETLTGFTVPQNVTNLTIGQEAFSYCEALTGFNISSEKVTNLNIGNSAFNECTALKTFTISSENITNLTIGGHAFSCCETLTGFTVPQNVTNLTIGQEAFSYCEALTGFNISSEKVTNLNIGNSAFNECTALKTFTISSENITNLTIGDRAFRNCQLDSITVKQTKGNKYTYKFAYNDTTLKKGDNESGGITSIGLSKIVCEIVSEVKLDGDVKDKELDKQPSEVEWSDNYLTSDETSEAEWSDNYLTSDETSEAERSNNSLTSEETSEAERSDYSDSDSDYFW